MTTDNVLIKVDNLCKSFGDTAVLKGINAEIDKYVEIMAPELEKHYERWPDHGSVTSWERHVGRLRTFADERTAYMVKHMQDWFDLSDSRMEELLGDLFTE